MASALFFSLSFIRPRIIQQARPSHIKRYVTYGLLMHRDCDRHAPVDDPLFRSRDGHRTRHSAHIKNRKKERSDRMCIGYETRT